MDYDMEMVHSYLRVLADIMTAKEFNEYAKTLPDYQEIFKNFIYRLDRWSPQEFYNECP
jgi:hypothetical protein